jgi:ribosomal protein S27E
MSYGQVCLLFDGQATLCGYLCIELLGERKGSEMKINCLSCGFKVDLSDAYDNYEGQVKCYACGATLEIKTQEGSVRAVQAVKDSPTAEVIEVVEVFNPGRGRGRRS